MRADEADEAALERYADELAEGLVAQLAGWTVRSVAHVCELVGRPFDDELRSAATRAGERCRDEVGPALRQLLRTDVDQQRTSPLALLRSAVVHPTGVLEAAGVAPLPRDEFDARAFPDDVYGLSPVSFADVDPSLTEPGLRWGAAKAHVHLARRRAEGVR